jgi:hypothetical protein
MYVCDHFEHCLLTTLSLKLICVSFCLGPKCHMGYVATLVMKAAGSKFFIHCNRASIVHYGQVGKPSQLALYLVNS